MAFALTRFIFPLEKSIQLSTHFDFVLDNPRTAEEVALVKSFIRKTFTNDGEEKESKVLPLLSRFAVSLSDFKEYCKKSGEEKFALDYFNASEKKPILDILSETWVILRFKEPKGQFEVILKDRDTLFEIVYSKKGSEHEQKFDSVQNYCYILSLLSNFESQYHGRSFLLSTDPYQIFSSRTNEDVYHAVETIQGYHFLINRALEAGQKRGQSWLYWLDGKNKLLDEAKRLDTFLPQPAKIIKGEKIRLSQKQTPEQKLLHIGNLLRASYEHLRDPELMLLLLVSIIEYLVTRNPDNNRFNVEDSITKQFKMKCAVLIHNQDKKYDLQKLNDDLSIIYSRRSDIAHGNYRDDFKVDDIVDSVYQLYDFITTLINSYLNDRDFMDYLKDN